MPSGPNLKVIIQKEKKEWWPRLLKSIEKNHSIKVDFNNWADEDYEDVEDFFKNCEAVDIEKLEKTSQEATIGSSSEDDDDNDPYLLLSTFEEKREYLRELGLTYDRVVDENGEETRFLGIPDDLAAELNEEFKRMHALE
uniref:Uncharacterized protein n=1 Tax=Panagrolaimus davidi TaxID=227884 RepID=A0A914QF11_9BILA